MQTAFLDEAPTICITAEGLVRVPPHEGLPAVVMSRRVALLLARHLMGAVAAIEDRDAAAPAPVRLHGG